MAFKALFLFTIALILVLSTAAPVQNAEPVEGMGERPEFPQELPFESMRAAKAKAKDPKVKDKFYGFYGGYGGYGGYYGYPYGYGYGYRFPGFYY